MRKQRLAALAVILISTIEISSVAIAKPPLWALGHRTIENQGCPEGSFSIVTAPDGGAISVLFDHFAVEGTEANGGFSRMTCAMEIPLHLPDGYSLGVYKVDYRGFARLDMKQRSELQVDYGIARGNRGRRYHRDLKGVYEGDFTFSERLGAGIMKRAGCGDDAVLNFSATLTLTSKLGSSTGTMALDTIDGAPGGGLIFGLDLRKCGPKEGNRGVTPAPE